MMTKKFATETNGKGDKKSGKDASAEKPEPEKIPEHVLVEKRDAVTLIGINRPEKRNSVDSLTANQLVSGKKIIL